MGKRLVQNKRDQDGKYALLLESEDAVQRDMRRDAVRRQREQQVIDENAEWCRQMGFDPADAVGIFA